MVRRVAQPPRSARPPPGRTTATCWRQAWSPSTRPERTNCTCRRRRRRTPATVIVAVEPNASRRDLAVKYGASDVIDPRAVDDVVATVHEICGGPADAALDCTGIVPVVRQAIDSVGMLGTAVLIGGAPARAEFSADHLT